MRELSHSTSDSAEMEAVIITWSKIWFKIEKTIKINVKLLTAIVDSTGFRPEFIHFLRQELLLTVYDIQDEKRKVI